MFLSEMSPAKGACKKRKRVGRGPGSGHGKTACKGEKGQKSRSGFHQYAGFEGGQMPLKRRLPKRGFKNIFAVDVQVVNLEKLGRFKAGTEVDPKVLAGEGLIASAEKPVKVLGKGKVEKALVIKANAFSESAKAAIEKAGGKAEVI